MRVSRVLALCGVAAGVSWAVANQPQTQPKSDPNLPSSANPKSTASTSDASSLLKQLQGRWKVEITIDPVMWNPHLFNDNSQTGNHPSNPTTSPADTRDPSSRTPASNSSANLAKIVTGYAHVDLILGDRVLQETTVLPDMKAKMEGATEGTTDRTRSPEETPASSSGKTAGDDMFKGISLLSFDETSKTYSMVFVDNCQGSMRFATGTYDAASNRIVFNSAGHGSTNDASTKDSPAKDKSTIDSSQSRTGGAGPTGQGNRHSLAGVQVVLELVNANEHRVTMYANARPMSADPAHAEPGRTTPASGTPKDATKDNNPSSNPPSNDRTSRPTDHDGAKVIYRAVYQRATGDDLNKLRDALRISDANDK